MGEVIYESEFCHVYWIKDLKAIREDWHIANCPLDEFKNMLYFMMDYCVKNKAKNLIIDAFGAISLLPESHHDWLDREFNREFVNKTDVDQIFLIIPESLVTSISVNKYYDSIKRNDFNISVYKMKSLKEVISMLKVNMG
jgi:hypothetical protein